MPCNHSGRIVFILVICQALYWAAASIAVIFSALAGYQMAEHKGLATLPFAFLQLGTAAAALPVSRLMERFGRRSGFMVGAIGGITGGAVSGWAILQNSFFLFCLGNVFIGIFQACSQHYRYAAGEVSSSQVRAKAISFVIAGGLIGVLLGPEIASIGQLLVAAGEYAGPYFGLAALALTALALSALLSPLLVSGSEDGGSVRLGLLAHNRRVVAGVSNTAVAYAVMVLVMTATPLAIVSHGHSVEAAANVVRWHMFAMFAPSIFAGYLAKRVGSARLIIIGNVLMLSAISTSVMGASLLHFWVALVLLGVGWNFMFVGATAILTEISHGTERIRAQAINETLLVMAVAVSALLSGVVLEYTNWKILNVVGAPLLAAGAAVALVYIASSRQPAAPT